MNGADVFVEIRPHQAGLLAQAIERAIDTWPLAQAGVDELRETQRCLLVLYGRWRASERRNGR